MKVFRFFSHILMIVDSISLRKLLVNYKFQYKSKKLKSIDMFNRISSKKKKKLLV